MSEEAEAFLRNTMERIAEENQDKLPPEKRMACLGQPFCEAENDGFTCTRSRGHTDAHVAHGRLGTVLKEWQP